VASRLVRWMSNGSVRIREIDSRNLYRPAPHPPVKDYGPSVAAAIEWLGDRYLLARPVKVVRRKQQSKDSRMYS
jgi:hypothetical protein